MSEKETPTRKHHIAYLAVIALLATAVIILAYKFVYLQNNTDLVIRERVKIEREKDSLSNEYQVVLEQYENLQTSNETLNAQLSEKQEEIKKIMTDLQTARYTSAKEREAYKKELETLRVILRDYVAKVDSLNQITDQQAAELINKDSQIRDLRSESEELESVKDSLAGQVEIASNLQLRKIASIGLNKRNRQTIKADKLEKVRICFTIDANPIAPKGARYFYIRIADPKGNVLYRRKTDLFTFEDKKIVYTTRQRINYDGSEMQNCIYWDALGESLQAGRYSIGIFADGERIGAATFVLQ